ncbi:cation-transporting P-type ATPase [Endozoicomonas sp. SM1973]|uniref:Cation-transporting P-type ATPase n=1 Tax=Spartinivicinus marinus TaxID=2994442 RepID=A0A853IHB3_9GAMM|nr:cation-transporting P-type ATPase [Spartinivicinus marinus]MCX4029653.1 cation-transporting P-type ATPase [Spartinivicinus marinus]NYZ66966.1 cation-transporting P-type ATPase [Spartinivicinus marinus]
MSPRQNWWNCSVADVISHLGSNEEGLSQQEAQQRLHNYGFNRLPEAKQRSWLNRLLAQFNNALIYVLIVSASITALLQHWLDTTVILGVVIINAVIGLIQEGKAEKALNAIRALLSPQALVRRNSETHIIEAAELVPGDIVQLQPGDKIPADLRLLKVRELHIDEAILTGESQAVVKSDQPDTVAAPLAERFSMAYSGTLVTSGTGVGIVTSTGANTEIGRISGLIGEVKSISTPLLRQVARFAGWLSAITILLAAATFCFGWLGRNYSATDMFIAAVGLAVAAIPEGLPAILTITLAIGVQRMANRHAIIRQLPAVETLGSVTVICSDKTGTLTRNEMTVTDVVLREEAYPVSGVGYEPKGNIGQSGVQVNGGAYPDLDLMMSACLLCNDATLQQNNQHWQISGDPTEAALITLAYKYGLISDTEKAEKPRLDEIPFASEYRFMATLHHDHHGHYFAIVKGAPEQIIEMCNQQRLNGEDQPFEPDWWLNQANELASNGKRVLAIAYLNFTTKPSALALDDISQGLTMVGLVGMVDPPRPEAIRAVAMAQSAGIQVKMITGDHTATAAAIGRQMQIGLDTDPVTGSDLEQLSDQALQQLAHERDVFARTSPEHKLKLVQALQAQGHVVAMTGDGVNDAPALKRAEVGIAMGCKGTEAAKQASRVVLADDNFASIVDAVEEGRVVYDNLKKAIMFILPTSGGEALSILAAIALGVVLPITPVQILWINMVTAVTLAMTLGFEPAESDVMKRPPRKPDAPLLSKLLIWRTCFVSILMVVTSFGMYLWYNQTGHGLNESRTIAVNVLVFCEIFYLLNTRVMQRHALSWSSLTSNIYLWYAIGILFLLQMAFTYSSYFQYLFQTSGLTLISWLHIISSTLLFFIIIEIEKYLLRRFTLTIVP